MSRDAGWNSMLAIVTELFDYGEEIYGMLEKSIPDNTEMLVCPAHMGDTLLIAALAKEYKSQNALRGLIFVVATLPEDVLKLYPEIDSVLTLDKEEMKCLRFYMQAKKLWYQNGIRYAHARESIYFDYPMVYTKEFSGIRWGFRESRLRDLELKPDSLFSSLRVPSADNREELLKKYGKGVLLMPVSYSTDMLPPAFWVKLAKAIKKRGYEVYTNYNGAEGEEIIEGTKPFHSTYLEFAQMTEIFFLFVGLRSGLCDLLSLTGRGNLVILYHEAALKGGSELIIQEEEMKESNIYDLGRREGIICYRYLSGEEEKVIDGVCKKL